MVEIYRNLFIIICLSLLVWGVIRIDRIYQYPFFMGSIFTSFLLPQVFSLIANPSQVSTEALERVIFISCLCASACWIGYQFKPNKIWLKKLNIIIDDRKLFRAGIALMAEAWFFNFLLSRITIQLAANGNWTGPATIFIFFVQAGNIAFAIFLLQTLKRPNFINFTCTALSGWPILQDVLNGRRQPTMTFIIIIGLSLFLIYRKVPPRWLVISGLLAITIFIPLFGHLRANVWGLIFSGNWQEIQSETQRIFTIQQKGDVLELRNAALIIDIAARKGLYGFGAGWWDNIIFQFVPGQLVGFEFKRSIQFNTWPPYIEALSNFYGYTIPIGSTPTAIGDSFMEFGYFGCLAFVLIAYIFKNLWISAVYQKNVFSQILYIALVSPSMICLTHGVGTFLQQGIFQLIFIGLVGYYSKVKYNL
ncbi:hypothetical protein NIES4071_19240 [Calothrix sp. NIES-4071]|nr:hypothetical protein NIES4071_19240 [Calothrix sp. NIES-4071]BAZ56257.1 hypothetical protein NIES4105_19190 [Calothrix sp. NIES-4105]